MFGRFHEAEEVRIMHDAGHIGFRKFDPARCFEFVGHAFYRAVVPSSSLYRESTLSAIRCIVNSRKTALRPAFPIFCALAGSNKSPSNVLASASALPGSQIKPPPVDSINSGNAACRGCTTGKPEAQASSR